MIYDEHKEHEHIAADFSHGEHYMPEWRRRIMEKRNIRFLTRVSQINHLLPEEHDHLHKVRDAFRFKTNSYYLSLVNWNDKDDPIRKIVVPDPVELDDEGLLDPCLESAITVVPGCQHKYSNTALLLVSHVCASLCRFCFRKRIFMKENHEVSPDLRPGIEYIRAHKEIDNVLLTGGDAFMLRTRRIAKILEELRSIPHVRSIRFGSKLLAFNPFRFIDDSELMKVIATHSKKDARIYVVCHFNHPREITEPTLEAVNLLLSNGVQILNQTPLLAGINDDPETLARLFTTLSEMGIAPYYIFQCRPTQGNIHFMVPFSKGIDIVEKARTMVSGLAKRARFVGSHSSGKIEILGYDDSHQYFRYHQAKNQDECGRFFKLPAKPEAMWWDEWMPDNARFGLSQCPCAQTK
jgi:lysine 2,3-aminomutase